MGFGDIRKKKFVETDEVSVKKKKVIKKFDNFKSSIPLGAVIETRSVEDKDEELEEDEEEDEYEEEEDEEEEIEEEEEKQETKEDDVIPNWLFLLILGIIYSVIVYFFMLPLL